MTFAEACVYARVRVDDLDQSFRDQSPLPREENKRWSTAEKLLHKAQRNSAVLPVILADAADRTDLLYWGVLTEIVVSESTTKYTVDCLRRVADHHTPQDLTKLSDRKPIAAGYRRSYSLCVTPGFLSDALSDPDE